MSYFHQQSHLNTNRSNYSNLSSNSDFTVRTGPSHINVPLGMTASHDHYIKPVPPTYVTEYEEKFVWPNVDYNNAVGSRFGFSYSPKSPAKYDSSVSARTSIESLEELKEMDNKLSNGKYWDRMENSLISLSAKGYDRTMSSALLKHIKERDFVEGLDYAYTHFQNLLHEDARKGDDVRKMMLDFIHSVDIIKGHTTIQYEDQKGKKNVASEVGNQQIKQSKRRDKVDDRSQPKNEISNKNHPQPTAEWISDKTIKVSLV